MPSTEPLPTADRADGSACAEAPEAGGPRVRVGVQSAVADLVDIEQSAGCNGGTVPRSVIGEACHQLIAEQDEGSLTSACRRADRACCEQHRSDPSPGIGEDQHADNTNKTALRGSPRHDCCHNRTSPVTSKMQISRLSYVVGGDDLGHGRPSCKRQVTLSTTIQMGHNRVGQRSSRLRSAANGNCY
jgi:hypothetical protein